MPLLNASEEQPEIVSFCPNNTPNLYCYVVNSKGEEERRKVEYWARVDMVGPHGRRTLGFHPGTYSEGNLQAHVGARHQVEEEI